MGRHAQEAERLRRLPYHIVLMRDAEGDEERCWTARVQELPGCEARERTSEEAARAIYDAMEDWLDAALQKGAEIPEPRRPSTHSGRLLLTAVSPARFKAAVWRRALPAAKAMATLIIVFAATLAFGAWTAMAQDA